MYNPKLPNIQTVLLPTVMVPITGPKGCLPKIAREIWMRRHWWTPWLCHDEKLNVGNDRRMTLQSVIEELWIA